MAKVGLTPEFAEVTMKPQLRVDYGRRRRQDAKAADVPKAPMMQEVHTTAGMEVSP